MESLKILVVDDEARMRKLVKDFLTNKGFQVIEAGDGEEAVDIFFADKDIALVLLDVMMPKISGFDVLDILRNTPETANVRIIMLTALSQPKDKERAESLGVDDYLVKSQVVIGDVVARVKHHLGMQ